MASCQINISGSGTVLIKYVLGGIKNEITADSGDPVFLDTTVTNVTYTVISGLAGVTSSCIAITNLPRACYKYSWSFSKNCISCAGLYTSAQSLYKFKYLLYTTENSITETNINLITPVTLASEINNLGIDNVKATAYQVTETLGEYRIELILTVFGTVVPEIVMESPIGPDKMYLKGTASSCLPTGFTNIDIC